MTDNKGFSGEEKIPKFDLVTVTTQNSTPQEKSRDGEMKDGKPSMTVKVILKNVFVVSLAFTFLFTAFNSMANLQTSLNKEDGVGAWSMSTIYVSLIVSCMFLPNFIISRLGCKWTIPISMIGYILFMGANFYAVKGTMIPASIILGMGAAPLWSAKCTYLTQIGVWYSKLTNQDQDGVINTFFGFFFLFFQTSQIWGNLISSLVFTPDQNKTDSGQCGAAFCPSDAKGNGSDNFSQTSDKVYTVCGIYIASAVIAVIIASLFLDQITLDKETKAEDRKLSPQLLVSTFRHLFSSPIQVMLIPLTIYSGVEQAFIGGDFTKAFISCSLGIWNLGYVMICYGVADALCSFLFGKLVTYIGHIPFFVLAFGTHGGLQIAFLKWSPQSDQEIIFYVCAALWGMGDAVIQTQVNALYGHLFSDKAEAAFANYRLWESLGFAVTFAYNDYLCTDTKLYVCLGVLGTAVICYTIVEVMAWRKKKYSADITN
ncbi:protein unc-93 homolog A-like [Biomphalaria glabrata]|uniref:Protein unc-93 homolog A-like n=1 Tax=Biomphalaria glabrata TaxID=6526 RepID=A0A9W3AXL0_BIOGL|nr:protein unc-93 homolog A-like [Biomphalaria glabrata]XP_055891960.1 protein unc-93 homolog A-like [Biomphalaria glabrata]XP_055891961.1 protein unc-93 homolog A-like [Biomphalaria glabrata]XP_055891962.1 protein unc-93 homolog A-like [Biomphalaria glabrata]XP_055891963.1 protein unc-93 homolog A-like [Biomphalaria glabrata]